MQEYSQSATSPVQIEHAKCSLLKWSIGSCRACGWAGNVDRATGPSFEPKLRLRSTLSCSLQPMMIVT